MADPKGSAPEPEFKEDGSRNPAFKEPGSESESAADTKNKGKEGEGAAEGGEGEAEGFDDTIDPNKPPEIPVRKNVAEFILNRKLKKEKKAPKEGTGDGASGEGDGGDEGEESEQPADVSGVHKQVKETLAPLLGKMATDADEAEFQALIKAEPEAAKYANHIRAYMSHENYKGIPVDVIYHHLAFEAAKRIGAKKKAVADKEANLNRGGGRNEFSKGSSDKIPSAEEIADMSEEDFDKLQESVLTGAHGAK